MPRKAQQTSPPPSPNGANGRAANGRFAPGNKGGPGNPLAKKVAELRSALLASVSPRDVQDIVRRIKREAKNGDIAAARELLDRVLGKAVQAIQVDAAGSAADDVNADTPGDVFAQAADMIGFYARFCVPKQAWVPLYLMYYEGWHEGRNVERLPANFGDLAEEVERRCNWVRLIQPAWSRFKARVTDGSTIKDDDPRVRLLAGERRPQNDGT
jgi:hypothetical protein